MTTRDGKLLIQLHREHYVAVEVDGAITALREAGYEVFMPRKVMRGCTVWTEDGNGAPYMCGQGEDEEIHHPSHGHVPEMAYLVPVGGDS